MSVGLRPLRDGELPALCEENAIFVGKNIA